MREVFKLSSSALPDSTRVAGFRGTEGISRPYEFEIYLVLGADGQDLDLADAVGAKAKLELDREDGRPDFVFHGIFAEFELIHEMGERSLFHATLVPQLWGLTQTFHSRIFTHKTIPEIIEDVLVDSGLASSDFVLKLAQKYDRHEHVSQYRESNFDFISRWMEREGMYYYFEQGEDAEKLVIADDKSFQKVLSDKNIRFYALSGHDATSGEALHSFTCKHRTLPARVKVKDYDYAKPTLDVSGSALVSNTGLGEISLYGARFFSPDEGKRLAKLRSEELLTRQVVYRGSGTAFYMRAGYRFELEDHPRAGFDGEYLVTEVEHVGNQSLGDSQMRALTGITSDKVYFVDVKAIPASVQFRAPSKTPWPRIDGVENGTICGSAESEYAQIDDHGRYNVKFKYDESDLKDGRASTWVRMMQPHGGSPEGFHFPLRKGTEVVFTFLGGDPDRPVIAGVVPNMHTPSPVTKGNHTLNVVQTGGRNRWELEDKAGQERITMLTPYEQSFVRMGYPNKGHTMIVQTNKATLLNAGTDFDLQVGQIGGKGSWDAIVKDSWTSTVEKGGFTLAVCLDAIKPSAGQIDIKAKKDINIETTTGNHTFKVDAGTWTTTVKGDTTLHVEQGHHAVNIDTGNSTTTIKTGNTKIDTQAGTTDILSKGLITIKSSGNDVYIEGDKVTTKARSDKTWTILGNEFAMVNGNKKTLTIGCSKAITLGVTQSVFIGLQNNFKLSGELSHAVGLTHSVFVGGKSTVTVALQSDITLAAKFAMEASISYSINAALKLGINAIDAKQTVSKLKQHGIDLTMGGLFTVL